MPNMSGVGISFGADRIYDVMTGLSLFPEEVNFSTRVFFTNLGQEEQAAALVSSMLTIERPPRRLDATDGMAVALCHHFMSSNPLNGALGEDRFKGLGGGRKAASAKGSSSWERFLKDNPQREIRQTPRTPQKTNHKPTK